MVGLQTLIAKQPACVGGREGGRGGEHLNPGPVIREQRKEITSGLREHDLAWFPKQLKLMC